MGSPLTCCGSYDIKRRVCILTVKHNFILVGNKCDLECERFLEYSTAKKFADSLNILSIETSAKESINVEYRLL